MKKKINKKKVGRPPTNPGDLAPPRWGIEDDGTFTKEYESYRFGCDRMAEELEWSREEAEEFVRRGGAGHDEW